MLNVVWCSQRLAQEEAVAKQAGLPEPIGAVVEVMIVISCMWSTRIPPSQKHTELGKAREAGQVSETSGGNGGQGW